MSSFYTESSDLDDIARSVMDVVNRTRGVTNQAVENFCHAICEGDARNNFYGVFASDEIPRHLLTLDKFTIIVNLAERRRGQLNGHFVTICTLNKNSILYIDSFGHPPYQKHVRQFLRECVAIGERQFYRSSRALQPLDSSFCGLYAILFASYFNKATRCLKISFIPGSDERNDKRCIEFLKKLVDEIFVSS